MSALTFGWDKVCCQDRVGPNGEIYPHDDDSVSVTTAERDAERILTSSSFRRLQGKTQVYPLPQTDFVRNRLTHTIEVAHIGRTLTTLIAKRVGASEFFKATAPQIVYNACLLHDIGNPPFGHSGESSIREFFGSKSIKIPLVTWATRSPAHKCDLALFDGNAQGFRIATRLAGWKHLGGLRLSAGTLSSMVKYPYPSTAPVAKEKEKFGFLSSETEYAHRLFERCGLVEGPTIFRNPLSIIVEAADDIAYLTSDVQDAHRYKDIKYNEVRQLLLNLSSARERPSLREIDENEKDADYEENSINYLRAAAISHMVKAAAEVLAVEVFQRRQQRLGEEKFSLWSNASVPTEYKHLKTDEDEIRKACNVLIYRGVRKISTQVAGGRIIKFVLQTQIQALSEIYSKLYAHIRKYPDGDERTKHDLGTGYDQRDRFAYAVRNIDRLVSREAAQIFWGMPTMAHDVMGRILQAAFERNLPMQDPDTAFDVIQISLDFVSGTTDRYLSDYSKSLSGPTLT